MYNLTIHFGPNAVAWSFLFKGKEKAATYLAAAFDALRNAADVEIDDDYGQSACIKDIHGVLLEDMDLSAEARIIRGIDNAKGQARFNKRASTDPELQHLNRSPSVLTPFPSGGRHQ